MPATASYRICPRGHRYKKSSDCPVCPECEEAKKPAGGFLALLSAPARRALEGKGINTLKKLSQYSEKELLALHGMGKATLPTLRKLLDEAGLSFKGIKASPKTSKGLEWLRKQCLSLTGTSEAPHFEKTSFRFNNKIFATYDLKNNRACLKLPLTDQDLFSAGSSAVYPVPNKWGQQGWTFAELTSADKKLLKSMLACAYNGLVAPAARGNKHQKK